MCFHRRCTASVNWPRHWIALQMAIRSCHFFRCYAVVLPWSICSCADITNALRCHRCHLVALHLIALTPPLMRYCTATTDSLKCYYHHCSNRRQTSTATTKARSPPLCNLRHQQTCFKGRFLQGQVCHNHNRKNGSLTTVTLRSLQSGCWIV